MEILPGPIRIFPVKREGDSPGFLIKFQLSGEEIRLSITNMLRLFYQDINKGR